MRRAPALPEISIERLAVPRRPHRVVEGLDWRAPIDRSRWFVCETLTPLYYTRIYQQLSPGHRRRYNQLTGMYANELIAFLEREFLDVVLNAVRSAPASERAGSGLRETVDEFRREERQHVALWRRLNRLSDPERYARTDRCFLRVPAVLLQLARLAARHPGALPVVFWLQLAQEERSIEISRRCALMEAEAIEPRYAAIYRAHGRDEIRHVRIDCHFIERFYVGSSPAIRWTTAVLLERLLGGPFMVPGSSSRRVIAALIDDYPELLPVLPAFRRELRAVAANPDYRRMMYSRETTPITFEQLDRFPEFARLRSVLQAYNPVPERRS